MQDNPFEPDAGISGNTNDDDDVFIPFDTTGTIVSFESRVPTEFEMSNLPVIVITADQWDPGNVTLSKVSRTIEENEMRTICSLASGLSKKEMEAMSSADGYYRNAELQYFCDRMIASENIACATRNDVDKREMTVITVLSCQRVQKNIDCPMFHCQMNLNMMGVMSAIYLEMTNMVTCLSMSVLMTKTR